MVTMVTPYLIPPYTIVVHEAEEGGYWGEVLELPGCVSQGETIDEFRHNISEALEAVLESEPTLAEKESIHFEISKSCGEEVGWVKVSALGQQQNRG